MAEKNTGKTRVRYQNRLRSFPRNFENNGSGNSGFSQSVTSSIFRKHIFDGIFSFRMKYIHYSYIIYSIPKSNV